ncbi:tetratricopeptide repeat protein [Paractinoplanes durhamensis]|uniref:tetratricopeptide repeat protein n=2 Tax=Paractinoplanes durhamensis TaxID=113563 RepID=UPI0031E38337
MARVSQPSPLSPAWQRAQELADSGDLAGARAVLERAVELGKVNLSEDDPDVLRTAYQLGTVLQKADDPAGARRVLEEAYAAGSWRLGDSDALMVEISHDIGVVAEELGNRHEARKAFGRVAEFGPAALGGGHWAVARARAYLGQDQQADVRGLTAAQPQTWPGPPPAPSVNPWQSSPPVHGDEPTTPLPLNVSPGPGPGPVADQGVSDVTAVLPVINPNIPAPREPRVDPAPGTGSTVAPPSPENQQVWTSPHASTRPAINPIEEATAAHPTITPRTEPQVQASQNPAPQAQVPQYPAPQAQHPGPQAQHPAPLNPAPHSPVPDSAAEQGWTSEAAPPPSFAPQSWTAPDGPAPPVWTPQDGPAPPVWTPQDGPAPPVWTPPDGPAPPIWTPQSPAPQFPVPHPGYAIEATIVHPDTPNGGWGQSGPPYIVEAGGASASYGKRGLGIFAAVAAVLAAVIAVAALVFVLANRSDKPAEKDDVPTLGGSPPSGVVLKDSGASIRVTWKDPSDGSVSFLVAMGHPGEQLKPVTTLGPGQTSYEVQALNPTLNYCFAVVAVYRNNKFATSQQACTDRPS